MLIALVSGAFGIFLGAFVSHPRVTSWYHLQIDRVLDTKLWPAIWWSLGLIWFAARSFSYATITVMSFITLATFPAVLMKDRPLDVEAFVMARIFVLIGTAFCGIVVARWWTTRRKFFPIEMRSDG